MNLWRSLEGMVTLRITSADPGGVLQTLNREAVTVYQITAVDDLTLKLNVGRKDLKRSLFLLKKRGDRVSIIRRRGLYFLLRSVGKRPVLAAGIAAMTALAMFLPTRVLFIRVEGNALVPSRMILEAAAESGVSFGASRREIRSEYVKNQLLGAIPELKWAGVNTSGCVATISVREHPTASDAQEENPVSSLVAARDGIIVSYTVTRGSSLCAVGQAVKAGQTLISGYTDCGLLVRAEAAEGEIMAQTRRSITAVSPPEGLCIGETRRTAKNYSLILGKKRINLWNTSGICGTTCGRMYEEYYITLPGGFVLPVALAVDTHCCRDTEHFRRQPEEAYRELKDFCSSYVRSQMVAGSILDADLTAQTGNDHFRLEAEYVCLEMIGRRRQEK